MEDCSTNWELSYTIISVDWIGLDLCCLMTPGLSQDIQCHM